MYAVSVKSDIKTLDQDDSSVGMVDRLHRWTKWFHKTNTVAYSLIVWSVNRCLAAVKSLAAAMLLQGTTLVLVTLYSVITFCAPANPGSPGKWLLKQRESTVQVTSLQCSDTVG